MKGAIMIKTLTLSIKGMTCDHCEQTVSKALSSIDGIQEIDRISWIEKKAVIKAVDNVDTQAVSNVLQKKGYRLESIREYGFAPSPSSDYDFDLLIIGGGSAGFSGAIKAAEMGKSVIIVEKGTTGGTCVNVGCVPSKFIIGQVKKGKSWQEISIKRDQLVASLRKEKYEDIIESYKNKITLVKETASIMNDHTIKLSDGRTISAEKILLATGSRPSIPQIPIDRRASVIDSTGLLFRERLPSSLIIIGGRFIALELGQAFSRLGTKVSIIQRSKHLIPQYNQEISQAVEEIFKREEIEVFTDTILSEISYADELSVAHFSHQGKETKVKAEVILMATGRIGNTENLCLESVGLKTDKQGFLQVHNNQFTDVESIMAAGDVLASPALVYVAAKEGQTAVNNAFNPDQILLNYSDVPEVIFTSPQIARVGTVLEDENNEIRIFPIGFTPYGLANDIAEGKIVLCRNRTTHKITGAEIVAEDAGNLIQTITLAIHAGYTTAQLINNYFPYLTAVEGIKLAALTFDRDIHKLSCCAG